MDSIEIRVITTLEEVEQIRCLWSTMQWHPNGDIDFYSLIVKSRPEVVTPYVLLLSQNGEPVSLIAGRVENSHLEIKIGYKVLWRPKVRRLEVLYGGFMGKASDEINEAIVRKLLRSLNEERADLLLWSGVRWHSELQRQLRGLPNPLCRDYIARPTTHWTMVVPTTLSNLLEQKMNKKHRYWAKRTMRMLERDFPGAVHYASYSAPSEMKQLLDDAIKVARKTYQWSLGVGFRDDDEHRKRLQLESEKGRIRGFVLYLKEEPVAFWICTVYNDTVHLDSTGYDPNFRKYEVGTALFLRMIDEMCQQKIKSLDFGLGSAFYKERFGDSQFDETTISVFAFSLRGIFLSLLRATTQAPAEILRNLLSRLGLEQRLKTLWRRRLAQIREPKESNARV